MSRFSRYDTDEERLPDGMTRVGYDADTQVYTYRDADGSYWEGAAGAEYGRLTKVGDADEEGDDSAPFLGSGHHSDLNWRTEMRPLLNFGVIIGLFLILLFWYLHWATGSKEVKPTCGDGFTSYTIQEGDTCWDIVNKHSLSMDDLVKINDKVDCNALQVKSDICLPTPSDDADNKDPIE